MLKGSGFIKEKRFMKTPVFIDSNIWLYSFLKQDEEKRLTAKKVISSGIKNSICLSTQIINEVCFNLKRNNFLESEIKEIISSFHHDYRIILLNERIMATASDLREKYPVSFWDSLVIAASLSCRCEILYSEDMQHGQVFESKLKIIDPFK